jgi:hypothetical protein
MTDQAAAPVDPSSAHASHAVMTDQAAAAADPSSAHEPVRSLRGAPCDRMLD